MPSPGCKGARVAKRGPIRPDRFLLAIMAVCGLAIATTGCAPGAGSSAFWGGFWEGYNGASGASSYSAYGTIESTITNDFTGLQGGNVYALANGQIWEQTEYYYWYRYAFRPDVIIYSDYGTYKMKVEGISHAVTVRRLR